MMNGPGRTQRSVSGVTDGSASSQSSRLGEAPGQLRALR
jgi:hypothetical protein